MDGRNVGLGEGVDGVTPGVWRAGVGAMRVVLGREHGTLPPGASRLVSAIGQRLQFRANAVADVAPVGPEEAARRVRDPVLRVQVVRGLVVGALMDGIPSEAVVDRIGAFARAMAVEVPALAELRLVAQRRFWRARVRLLRRFWAIEMMRRHIAERGWFEIVRIVLASFLRIWSDRRLKQRYESLRSLPEGTLGRGFLAYLTDNGFPLPGQRGAAPETIVYHDLTHVLSGYGTDPRGEVQAACFQGGYRGKDPFAFVLFVLLQFHVGVRMTPGAKAETGRFDPVLAIEAIRRGAAMNRDLTDGTWDYWQAMGEDLEQLRRRLGVPEADLPTRGESAAA